MMKLNPTRVVLFFLSAFLLTACGGGGDGGGGSDGGGSSGSGYTQLFNPLMPLLSGSTFEYHDSAAGLVTADISKDTDTSTSTNKSIYRIAYNFADNPLSLLVESTATQISLYGIDGPVVVNVPELGGDTEVDEIRLKQPIIIYSNDSSLLSDSIAATAHVSSPYANGTVNLNLSYTKAETTDEYAENGEFGEGDLPMEGLNNC